MVLLNDWFATFWDLIVLASTIAFIMLISSLFLWLLDKI